MAFTSISSVLIQVGKPVVQQLWQVTKDNFDDLNTRLSTVEGAASKIEIVNGTLHNASSIASISDAFGIFEAQSSFTLTDAKVGIFDVSGPTWAGTLSFDVRKASSLDFSSDVSIFTTKPSIDFTSPTNYSQSSNAVFSLANKDIAAGDRLRIDIDSLPTGGILGSIHVILIGEAS